jgi:hypothetical protein
MANAYDGTNVKVGPGTLYAAALGSAEPADATTAWPSAWVKLGYTDNGSTFTLTPSVSPVTVEEEFWPVRQDITSYDANISFALAETTARNWALALNNGIGTTMPSGTHGVGGSSDVWVEPGDIGTEQRVMLGWDSLSSQGAGTASPFGRIVIRQTFQTGALSVVAQKSPNKRVLACQFGLEKPAGVQPVRFWFPSALAGGIAT